MKKFLFQLRCYLIVLLLICLWPIQVYAAEKKPAADDSFFTLENGINLRQFGSTNISHLLVRIRGQGIKFGEKQCQRYCNLKHAENIQWVLNDLDTGAIITRSANADEVYFGASVAKIFVAAALLNKQDGQFQERNSAHYN
jgi:D-alanyl-D-alanine carboxypeptidase